MAELRETGGIQYKYFVAQKSAAGHTGPLFLKFIEYNWRQIGLEKLSTSDSVEVKDKWPLVDVENRRTRIDSGWLLDQNDHEIQFHFFKQPLELWSRVSHQDLVLSIVPYKAGPTGLSELRDYFLITNV